MPGPHAASLSGFSRTYAGGGGGAGGALALALAGAVAGSDGAAGGTSAEDAAGAGAGSSGGRCRGSTSKAARPAAATRTAKRIRRSRIESVGRPLALDEGPGRRDDDAVHRVAAAAEAHLIELERRTVRL